MKKADPTFFLSVLFIAVPIAGPIVLEFATQDEITFTVEKTERISEEEFSRYLIFTEDEIFENTDSFAFLKFNSSDIYGRIDEGKTYRAKVTGARVPLFSWYRNIIEIQEESK